MSKQSHLHETDKDRDNEVLVTGRHQEIGVDPAAEYRRATLAAGAVLWRGDASDPEVAVIHRPHYDDWSLAKGKVDPGEALPTTAAREISEETGLEVRLGKLIGKVTYPVMDRTKVVYYWTGKVEGGEFTPNDEVDEIRWMSIDEACDLVSYDLDAQVLRKAEKRLKLAPVTRVLYVRHARAHDRKKWDGDDLLRPLDKKGRRQAEMLVPMLLPYKPTAVYSAEPDRCMQTAAPLADELNLDIMVNKKFGDLAFLDNPDKAFEKFMDVVNRGGTPVIVGQGTVIPGIIEMLNPVFFDTDDVKCKKSSVWVLSFNDGELTGADYLASPLPVR